MKGSVQKQGETWRYAIYLGVENGKRRYLRKGGILTQQEAQKAMREILSSVDNETFVEPTQMTVGEYLAEWLQDKATVVRYGRMRQYRWMINYHIVPVLGSVPLQSLTPQHVQSFYNSLRNGDKPLSLRSTIHVHRILHEALNGALQRGAVVRNVAAAVEAPKTGKPEIKVWTIEEATAFLNVARGNRYYVAFVLALETGMRWGEILGLKWSDVDLEGAKLHVKRTNSFGYSCELISGRRIVPLTPSLTTVLRSHKTTQSEKARFVGPDYQDHNLVICKQDGTPLRERSLCHHWYKLLKESELPEIRFNNIRHTFVSLMLTPPVLDIYSHVLTTQKDDTDTKCSGCFRDDMHEIDG
ncbi:site-specific integrase [Alicyclobacillus ferrooxydans]|uniref:site-specific integrase n=1 Tax=Alicyclobacillus ferrooxydans TaxID=471514 RepID=UPI0006D5AADA|nr:site-specific integrase [Alicyclobacillus ferrooxydans]